MPTRDRKLSGLNVSDQRPPSLNGRGRFIMNPYKTTVASTRKAMATTRNKKIKVTLPNGERGV